MHKTYCHEVCRWTDVEAFRGTYQGRETPNMGRLVGHREWETLYHGWNWADLVSDMGMVREDGNTMTAQPHLDLDPKKMWTLDHLRRCPAMRQPERPVQRDGRRRACGVHRGLPPSGPSRATGTGHRLIARNQAQRWRGRAGLSDPPPAGAVGHAVRRAATTGVVILSRSLGRVIGPGADRSRSASAGAGP